MAGLDFLGGIAGAAGDVLSSYMTAQQSAANVGKQAQYGLQAQDAAQQFNAAEAQRAREYNTQMVGNNQQFQQNMLNQQEAYNTNMSNTAYQRARADMTAAGINPMAMTSGFSGSSTPTISAPSGGTGSTGMMGNSPGASAISVNQSSPLSGFGNAVRGAMSTAMALRENDARVNNIIADTALKDRQSTTEAERPAQVRTSTDLQDTQRVNTQLQKAGFQRDAAIADNQRKVIDSWLGGYLEQAAYIGKKANDIVSPISNLVGSAKSWAGMNAARASRGAGTIGESFSDRFNSIYGNSGE